MTEDANGIDLSPSIPMARSLRRRRRANWALRILFIGLGLSWLIFVLVVPEVQLALHRLSGSRMLPESDLTLDPVARAILRSLEFVAFLWFFFIGASVGSFLNVVAWRLPRGKSFVAKDSLCPYCESKIRKSDNLPIIGWLKLRGRCRACHLPISPRYWIVEVIVGSLFLVVAQVELLSGGANLPLRPTNLYRGVVWIVFYTKWDLVGITAFHTAAFCFAVVVCLCQFDGVRFPGRWLLRTLLFVGTIVALFPSLHDLPWWNPAGSELRMTNRLDALISLGLGMVGGGTLALIVDLLSQYWVGRWATEKQITQVVTEGNIDQSSGLEFSHSVGGQECETEARALTLNLVSLGLLMGCAVGWQAIVGTLMVWVVLLTGVTLLGQVRFFTTPSRVTALFTFAFIVHHLLWRQVYQAMVASLGWQ